jgi:hypothetical protein
VVALTAFTAWRARLCGPRPWWPWQLAGGDRLPARARTERRHGGLLHLHRLASAWVTSGPGGPNALLEHAEPGDRHLVALGHGVLDLGEYRVERSGRRLPVAQTSRERFDELGLVHE